MISVYPLSSPFNHTQLDTLSELPANYWCPLATSQTEPLNRLLQHCLADKLQENHAEDLFVQHGIGFFRGTSNYQILRLPQTHRITEAHNPTTYFTLVLLKHGFISLDVIPSDACEAWFRSRFSQCAKPLPTLCAIWLLEHLLADNPEQRHALNQAVDTWQNAVLNPEKDFSDWQSFMTLRSGIQKAIQICEEHIEILACFQQFLAPQQSDLHVLQRETLTDICKQVQRRLSHLKRAETTLDTSTQIHFAIVGQRTNEIMRMLAVISGVFLPATLVTGFFGMNFEYLPDTHDKYGALHISLGLGFLMIVLTLWLKIRKWF